MDKATSSQEKKFIDNSILKRVSRKDFHRYLASYRKQPGKGPKPKLSLYKICNYLLHVLHPRMQWSELKTQRNALHWTNVYQWHHGGVKDGSFQALFAASVLHLHDPDQLAISILHGDGSNLVVKKGAQASAMRVTNTRKERKN